MTPVEHSERQEIRTITDFIISANNRPNEWKDFRNVPNGLMCSITGRIQNGKLIRFNEAELMSGGYFIHESLCYKLEDPQKDYVDFIKAWRKQIPIIFDWNILGDDNLGYFLLGNTKIPFGQKYVQGKIIRQRGNYLTLDNGKEYFVHWVSYGIGYFLQLEMGGFSYDLTTYGNSEHNCKPVLHIPKLDV